MLPRNGLDTYQQRRIAALQKTSDRGLFEKSYADLRVVFTSERFAMNAARRAPRANGSAGMSDFAVFTTDAIKRALGFILNTA